MTATPGRSERPISTTVGSAELSSPAPTAFTTA